jgi:iron complex outermembrane receptor protein
MIKRLLVFTLCIFSTSLFAQVTGKIIDSKTKEPMPGVKITVSDGMMYKSNGEGLFSFSPKNYPVTVVCSFIQFTNDTTIVNGPGEITIAMSEPVTNFQTVVISAGKRKQAVEEVPVSMEIIKPQLIDNKGITDLEQAVDQTPGVFTMDGQVSIRGGSGFAYGTGSRVLLLWNGMPLLSGYAGDTQWNAIPMEQADQVEVMKGASSVLYGSGALNGVISLLEKEPKSDPEMKLKIQTGIYDNPRRESLKWWGKNHPSQKFNPMYQQVEFYRGQMYRKAGYTVSTTFFRSDGYRDGEGEMRGRVSGTVYIRPETWKRTKMGIGYNYQVQKTGNFLIWQSDTLGYTPSGGTDTSNAASTLTYNLGHRLFIDPYLKYTDKYDNKHSLKTRMYYAQNTNLNNVSQSNGAIIYYTDYQFQKQFDNGIILTSGLSNIRNVVFSNLFGDHNSNNAAAYVQYEHKITDKLDLTGGMRIEHFIMDGKGGDSRFVIGKDSAVVLPVYPILRAGLHYQIAKYTHLRISAGQGIRYPAVAERYTQTSVGALNIFPNAALTPEKGWAGEIGIKQGVKMGEWKGMFDAAWFINRYQNMIEFTFGVYNPPGTTLSSDPSSPYYFNNWVGFRANNAEAAQITGLDLSFNSMGKIGDFEIISLIGYTYMNPISLNNDSTYIESFSDTTSGMLKYRFRHLAKADIEVNYKKFSFGVSCRYNSFMANIDKVFEDNIQGTFILPGLKEYRKIYNKGNLVFDARFAYKLNEKVRLSFIGNNIFNSEYTSRPGDIQPPRNFAVQAQIKF